MGPRPPSANARVLTRHAGEVNGEQRDHQARGQGGEQQPQADAAAADDLRRPGDGPAAGGRPRAALPWEGRAAGFGVQQPGEPGDVGENVDGHRAEPQDEGGLVQKQPRVPTGRPDDGEHDPGAEDTGGEQHEDRAEQPQQRRGRALAHVGSTAGVVAEEPVRHRAGLERDRAEQQHADKEVQGEQAVEAQDRDSLYGQQEQQDRPGHHGQPLVALGPAVPFRLTG